MLPVFAEAEVKLLDLRFDNKQQLSPLPSSLTIDITTNSSHFTIPASINRGIDHRRIPVHLNGGQTLQETEEVGFGVWFVLYDWSVRG